MLLTYVQPAAYDVTLVTFGTVDRLNTLHKTLKTWDGLIYVSIYVRKNSELGNIDKFIKSSQHVRERLTVHLLWASPESDEQFPVNALRNLALVGVPTTHFLYADIDFIPSLDGRSQIIKHQSLLADTYSGAKRQMLLVPAIQCHKPGDRKSCTPLEDRYETLKISKIKSLVKSLEFDLFGGRWKGYHSPTEVYKWMAHESPYTIPSKGKGKIAVNFEPYAVLPTRIRTSKNEQSIFLLWDEIFTAYGRNKIVYINMLRQIFEYKFTVLSTVCLFHKTHERSAESRSFRIRSVKKRMVKLFVDRMSFWQSVRNELQDRRGTIGQGESMEVDAVELEKEDEEAETGNEIEEISQFETEESEEEEEADEIATVPDESIIDQSQYFLELADMADIVALSTGDSRATHACSLKHLAEMPENWQRPVGGLYSLQAPAQMLVQVGNETPRDQLDPAESEDQESQSDDDFIESEGDDEDLEDEEVEIESKSELSNHFSNTKCTSSRPKMYTVAVWFLASGVAGLLIMQSSTWLRRVSPFKMPAAAVILVLLFGLTRHFLDSGKC